MRENYFQDSWPTFQGFAYHRSSVQLEAEKSQVSTNELPKLYKASAASGSSDLTHKPKDYKLC